MKDLFSMYMVGYDHEFKTSCNSGWGCGYVMIPKTSRVAELILREKAADEAQADAEDHYMASYYTPMHMNSEEECTHFEEETVNGVDYFVVGFDTAHINNGPHHDFDYVFSQTAAILKLHQELEESLPDPHLEDVI